MFRTFLKPSQKRTTRTLTFNKIMLKTARHRRHLHFSHRCKDLQVLPPSLRIKPPVRTSKGWKLSKTVGFQFLKLRIEDTHKKIRTLTREKEFALDFLRSRLTTSDLEHLETLVYKQQEEEDSRIRSLYSKKLQVLTSKSNTSLPGDTVNRDKWVLNISSKPLNNTETTALQKGTNFALVPKKIPTAEIVAGIEDGISGLPEDDKLSVTIPSFAGFTKNHRTTSKLATSRAQSFTQSLQRPRPTRYPCGYKVLEKDLTQRTERKLNEKLASLNERTRSVTAFTKDFAVLMDCLLVFVVYQRFISLVSPLDLLFRL